MEQVKFKWISRAKFNSIVDKDPNTIYFIYNEHVLYKGSHAYGGIQSISYITDDDDNYIIDIIDVNGNKDTLKVPSSKRLTKAIEELQDDLADHISTKSDETTSAHTKLTDTIDRNNPQTVLDNVAVTPKGVVDYIVSNPSGLRRYSSVTAFPIVGNPQILYYAEDNESVYIYKDGAYKLLTPSWQNIKIIRGETNINV